MKVYGYSRSNIGRNAVDSQNEQLIDYASNKLLNIEHIYSDVCSGVQIGAQLNKLINEIPENSILLVRDRSRLSRNVNDYVLIHRELTYKNVKIVFTGKD